MNDSLRIQVRIGQEFKELIDYLGGCDKEHRAKRLVVLAALQLQEIRLQERLRGVESLSPPPPPPLVKPEPPPLKASGVEPEPVSIGEELEEPKGKSEDPPKPEPNHRSAPSWVKSQK